MKFSKGLGFGVVLLLLASGLLLAQEIPLNNWTVPPYAQSSHSGGITTMTDVTSPRAFVGIQPCRVADTRGNGAPIQGGIFPNSGLRTWDVTGICGIPAGADAISVNFTVVAAAGIPAGSFLLAWPTGQAPPPTAIMTYGPGQIISNAAIVPLGPGEQLNVNVSGSTHVIMDVNGYFSDTLQNGGNYFTLTNNSDSFTMTLNNDSTTCGGACGLLVNVDSGHAIEGSANKTTGANYGVYGLTFSTDGGSAGVRGEPKSAICSNGGLKAGVLGVGGANAAGEIPVVGVGDYEGVRGINLAGCTTTTASFGSLGYTDTIAVFGLGDLSISGTKSFVDPHPTDASKVIKYVALEGPESGTYFRGRGRFQNGVASIDVPESFRLVTDSEGLSIQVTPIGQMATVAVESLSLDRIVVRGSRNVEFFYTVNGVRRTFKDFNPIQENLEFVPTAADAGMAEALSPEQKRLLIQNGTYRADGAVNMETARRLGWDQRFVERSTEPQRKPVVAPEH